MVQTVKNLPAMQETQVQLLDLEDPLEEGIATHSSILSWKIPWIEEPGGLQSMVLQRVRHDWATVTHTQHVQNSFLYFPILQSCLPFLSPDFLPRCIPLSLSHLLNRISLYLPLSAPPPFFSFNQLLALFSVPTIETIHKIWSPWIWKPFFLSHKIAFPI